MKWKDLTSEEKDKYKNLAIDFIDRNKLHVITITRNGYKVPFKAQDSVEIVEDLADMLFISELYGTEGNIIFKDKMMRGVDFYQAFKHSYFKQK